MALTPLHVLRYCKAGNICRYLLMEDDGFNQEYFCIKQVPKLYNEIKEKMLELDISLDKRDDNCQGYPFFKHLKQGYDQPN